MILGKIAALALTSTAMSLVAAPAFAQAQALQQFDLPSQDLGASLRQIAAQTGRAVIAPTEVIAGIRAQALKGRYTPDEAITLLLSGSGLRVVQVGETLVVREARQDRDGADADPDAEDEARVVVTGTRIRGQGPVGVTVITLDRKTMEEGGFSITQQLVQSIPQNYGGGANEGTSGLLTAAGNGNTARGAGVNLRGLGQNSTLLLINGDRPPLGGAFGTFADRYRDGVNISYAATLAPVANASTPLPGARIVKSVYGELLIPVFGDGARVPLFRKFDISAAVGAEDYSDFGRTTNPKFSLSWVPFNGVTIRGSYGKSFRAPGFTELRQDPGAITYFAYPVVDPQSATGTSNLMVLRGNDPDLRPERAMTWTLGADIRPAGIPGLHASVTWFVIDYRDRIASVASGLTSFLTRRDIHEPILAFNPSATRIAELYASPYYSDLGGLPRTAPILAIADARTRNLSIVKQAGLDVDLGYAFELAGGHAELGAVATYIARIEQRVTATSAAVNVVGTVGNPLDLRVRGRASWNSGSFGVALFANYADSYINRTTATAEKVRSWTTFDLNLSYAFPRENGVLKGLRISLNASNLFDRDPPYVSYIVGTLTTGFDAENASPLGRFVALQVTKTW